MVGFIKKWINEHRGFVNYFLISCFVTVLDIALSFVVEKGLSALSVDPAKAALIGNAVGVITGFIVQYFLCTKKVYAGSSFRTMVIFFLTWLLGLALAEGIIYVVRTLLFHDAEGMLYFLIGKGCSIAIPFFVTYFIRKMLIPARNTETTTEEEENHE